MGLQCCLDLCQHPAANSWWRQQNQPTSGAQHRTFTRRRAHLLVARGGGGASLPAGDGRHQRPRYRQLHLLPPRRANGHCQRYGAAPHCERAAGTGYQSGRHAGPGSVGRLHWAAAGCTNCSAAGSDKDAAMKNRSLMSYSTWTNCSNDKIHSVGKLVFLYYYSVYIK